MQIIIIDGLENIQTVRTPITMNKKHCGDDEDEEKKNKNTQNVQLIVPLTYC